MKSCPLRLLLLPLILGGLCQTPIEAHTTNGEAEDSAPRSSWLRRASAALQPAPAVRLASGAGALRNLAQPHTQWGGVTCYATGRRQRDQRQALSLLSERSEQPVPAPFAAVPQGPADELVARVLTNELAKVEATPTVAEAEYQVETLGRPGGEVIVVQFLPGGEEIAFAPFVEGFREPDRVLSRAGGRLIEGTAGLQLVTRGRWLWRLQMSHRFSNTVFGGQLGSDVGVMVLRRF